MAFNVRLHAYRGNTQMRDTKPKQYSADSVRMLEEPYEWSQVLASNAATPVNSVSNTTSAQVTMLKVEVPDGQGIRYEINPPGGIARVPGNTSPRLQGTDFFPFYPGWTFSFVDLANFA